MSLAIACPICGTDAPQPQQRAGYFICGECRVWHQSPLPPKLYTGAHEEPGDLMSEHDKAINRKLADHLAMDVMRGLNGKSLDIGSKYPYLAACLRDHGFDAAAMEADPEGERFAQMLGVRGIAADFEQTDQVECGFSLITMIHCFEHMYDPVRAIRKLRSMIRHDGRLFIRMPDSGVRGIERDLTPGHLTIHPYIHTLQSLLQVLVNARDCFEILSVQRMDGAGQTDYVLRPIDKAPTVCLAMIVKNEERDLPLLLESVKPAVDELAIVDTGSTDRTVEIASEAGAVVMHYRGASEENEQGEWLLWDFAKARNESLLLAEAAHTDWILWADGDDELKSPLAVRRATYLAEHDVYGFWIDAGGPRWLQQRMWKASTKVRFKGRCHEYPVLDGLKWGILDDALVVHHADPTPGTENSNPRNLRMLMREWDEDPQPRTAFYLGSTYKDAGRNSEAVEWYRKRIEMTGGFDHERLFAHLLGARCLKALNRLDEADEMLAAAHAIAPTWSEFPMGRAHIAYARGRYDDAIAFALQADSMDPIPPTPLWREQNAYRDQPGRLLSWCYDHTGDLSKAIAWAEVASSQIGKPDEAWDNRRAQLVHTFRSRKGADKPKLELVRPQIALVRPGAIGDVIMTLNLIPALRDAYPGHDIHYFVNRGIGEALAGLMHQAGVDVILDAANVDAWRKSYVKVFDLIGYDQPGYPERPLEKHIIRRFAENAGLDLPFMPSLEVLAPDRAIDGDYVTIQMTAAWSPYKNWPVERWQAVVDALPGIRFVTLGAPDDPVLHGENVTNFRGSIPEAIGYFANATLHAGVDSFAHHLTNYYWRTGNSARKVPAVILFGSTQVTGSGYADNTNISKGLACQPCFREDPKISRVRTDPCPNLFQGVHDCMYQITVDEVVEAILRLHVAAMRKEAA